MYKSVENLLRAEEKGDKMEIRKIRLVGNSLHVAIPEKMLKFIGIGKDNYVRVQLWENGIFISQVGSGAEPRERISR